MGNAAIACWYTAILVITGAATVQRAIAFPVALAENIEPAESVTTVEGTGEGTGIITSSPETSWDTALGTEPADGVWLYPEETSDDSEPVLVYPSDRLPPASSAVVDSNSDNTSEPYPDDSRRADTPPPVSSRPPRTVDPVTTTSPPPPSPGAPSSPPSLVRETPPTSPEENEILIYPDDEESEIDVQAPIPFPSPGSVIVPESMASPTSERSSAAQPAPIEINDGAIATEVRIEGVDRELEQVIREIIQVQVGQPVSAALIEADRGAIAGTGFFESVAIVATPQTGGVAIVYAATPIVVRSFHLAGSQIIPTDIFSNAFGGQVNRSISPRQLNQGADALDSWYLENGYTLSNVVAWLTDPSGRITVEVIEPTIGTVDFEFIEDGSTIGENGERVEGRTREDFILRELSQQPGDVFNQNELVQDLETLLSLGVFQDANIELIPNETPENPTVDLLYQLQEGFARSVRVGGGVSTELGLFGAVNYRDRNFRGIGEDINLGIQAGGRGLEFNTGYTSPYRDSRPNRLGYSVNGFRRSFQSLTFSDEVPLANGDDARERRFGGGASVMRPLGEWDAELGVDYARVSIRDEDGDIATEDSLGNALTASDSGIDDLLTVGFRVTQDRRLNPNNPAGGSILSFGTEQSIPIGSGNILLNRLTANYARYLPTDLLGSGNLRNPEVVAFNVRGGTVLGELPPYEAFDLGGAGSVRGYGGGDVGSGRSFILASAEYRFPLFSTLGGVLFTDFASDLGTGSSVEGDPAGSRDKPGTGFGYGVGLRFGSPIGLLRADFGFNDEGDNQFHFGFGQSF